MEADGKKKSILDRLLQLKDVNGQRYVKVGNTVLKNEKFQQLTAKDKEDLTAERLFAFLDKQLEQLNLEYIEEIDPIRKEILRLKYDIKIEEVGELNQNDKDYLAVLKYRIKDLEEQLRKKEL